MEKENEREAEGWVIKVHLIRSLHQLIMHNCSQSLNRDLKCSVLNVDWLPDIKGLFDVRVWIALLYSSLLGPLERDPSWKSQNLVQNEIAISAKKADLSGYTYFYWPLNCNLYFIIWICSCHKNIKTLCYCSLVVLVVNVKNMYVVLNVNVWRIIRHLRWLIFHWENDAERFVCICFNLEPKMMVINPSNVAVEIKIYS